MDFVDQIQNIQLQQGEYTSSYDVIVLFTSVPVDPAINIIRRKLEQDGELQHRKSMMVEHIFSPLEFCLMTTCFQSQGRFFDHPQEVLLGYPSAPSSGQTLHGALWDQEQLNQLSIIQEYGRDVDDTLVVLWSLKMGSLNTPPALTLIYNLQ